MHAIRSQFLFIAILSSLILSVLLTSCDPMQSMQIVNQGKHPATITFAFTQADRLYQFGEADTLQNYALSLEPGASQEFGFGMGHWKVAYSMDSLVASVQRIEIRSNNSAKIFEGEQEIRKFFTQAISRKAKSRMEIVLE